MNQPSSPLPTTEAPKFAVSCSRQFPGWLAEQGGSLAFTTYQAGKVFALGLQPNGRLSIYERSLPRCMGMAVDGDRLYISSLWQIHRFENALEPGEVRDGYDRVFLPQMSWITGDLDVHDMAVDRNGRLVFVNTLFGCLATLSDTHSFKPLWQPPFLSKLAAEDRCHMNGLAMRDGRPAYVSAVSESDVVDSWREHRNDGGVLLDVASSEVVARGFSMPHSPRWHRNRLWVHDSGRGHFGWVDLDSGRFEPVVFCPGYLRGMAFSGKYALLGLSKARHDKSFGGLALDGNLERHKVSPRCGIYVVDLETGDVAHWMHIEGVVTELYDVHFLPRVRRPMLIGFKSDEIRRMISIERSS